MIGGFLKTTSCLALLATAGVMMGGMSARAADLGGNCCADLEERVAELEATTARKGNRKVSLQIYGQVTETLIWFNDGKESNVFVQENNAVKNIVGFTGGAKINSDWSAGYKLELQIRSYRSSASNQVALGNNNGLTITSYNTQSVSLRHAHWYLESQTYGRLTVGRDNDAGVGTSSINLAQPDGFQAAGGFMGFSNGGYFMRRAGVAGNVGLSNATWANFAYIPNGDGPAPFDYAQTASQVKYTSPFFLGQSKTSGFQFQSSWGQDDMWAVALRYVEDYGIFRVAGAVSYADQRDLDRTSCSNPGGGTAQINALGGTAPNNGGASAAATSGVSNTSCNMWQASGSIMHVPTGLYVSGGGAQLTDNQRQKTANIFTGNVTLSKLGTVDNNDSYWWVQAGWEAKLNAMGKTTFYGTYNTFNRGFGIAGNSVQTIAGTDVINLTGATEVMSGSQTRQWGLGVTQAIDAAAMNLYLGYINTSTDITLQNTTTGIRARSAPVSDMDLFYTGATIKF